MLLASSLATPAIGTVFWTTLIFFILFFLLWKFAWGPIMKAVKSREDMIRNSLDSAEKAREEMKVLQADNETVLRKAREERDKIIREARLSTERMLTEAKEKSQSEADAMVRRAKELIEREKNTAIAEVKREVAGLAVEVASRVVSETLKSDAEQQKLIERYLKEIETTSN
ncbi:MAG: F0F1 ATP synthase subunit B [Bacteroidales bacterium]